MSTEPTDLTDPPRLIAERMTDIGGDRFLVTHSDGQMTDEGSAWEAWMARSDLTDAEEDAQSLDDTHTQRWSRSTAT